MLPHSRDSEPIGLSRLVAAYENRLLSKGKVTRSNWENYLNSEQQECAIHLARAQILSDDCSTDASNGA
jgi:hypothetical protein